MNGRWFTYGLLAMYAGRGLTLVMGKHYGPASYWLCCAAITISVEFLITRFP